MPRFFALDRNFPQPIVGVLSDFQADATLVPLDRIDTRMSTLDDWELLLALHHHADPWDGLITTDSSILAQGPELAALIQTKLTLVVAVASGHNPVKASPVRVPRGNLPTHDPKASPGMETQRRKPSARGALGLHQADCRAQQSLGR